MDEILQEVMNDGGNDFDYAIKEKTYDLIS